MKFRRILFQGDSITDGARGRNDDLNHILGHGYAYIIAGKLGYELAENRPLFLNGGSAGTGYRICMHDGMRIHSV